MTYIYINLMSLVSHPTRMRIGMDAPIQDVPHLDFIFFLGDNMISWSSKPQPTLSRSSAEVEYRGVANVVTESCWIWNLLLELHCLIHKATLVHCVQERVAHGQVRVLHVSSCYQIADIFTKGLSHILFEDF